MTHQSLTMFTDWIRDSRAFPRHYNVYYTLDVPATIATPYPRLSTIFDGLQKLCNSLWFQIVSTNVSFIFLNRSCLAAFLLAAFFSALVTLSLFFSMEEPPLSLSGVVAALSSLTSVSSTSSPKIKLIFFNRRLLLSGSVSGSYLKAYRRCS